MPKISLQINQPEHQAAFTGPAQASVAFDGQVVGTPPVMLYYRWYSGLYVPLTMSGPEEAALNYPDTSSAALKFSKTLGVGTHTITFTARDVNGEAMADLQSVQYAGMTGGPDVSGAQPRIIHVLIATMINTTAELKKSGCTLDAVAPSKWDDPQYQQVNDVRYRWRFEPAGGGAAVAELPGSNATQAEVDAFQASLAFARAADAQKTPYVRYAGTLPAALASGQTYRLVLRVERKQNPANNDEIAMTVKIVD